VACIYAELLGMLEGTRTEQRSPLFPGSACFPLSPDNKEKSDHKSRSEGKRDQLSMIFNMIGTPNEADIALLEREDARRYVRCFGRREPQSFQSKWPHVEEDSLDIMSKMLRFNPGERPRASQCVAHPLFTDIRVTGKETTAAAPLVPPDFEKEPDLHEDLLRQYFAAEVRKYRDVVEVGSGRWRHGGA